MDNRPIGVFDSGLGGLTAVKELLRILPNENIVYFGDTARVPYGSHSRETILEFARQDLSFLLSCNVKAVLIACGTVSSTSLDILRQTTEIPVLGVINAASEAAVRGGKKKVLVLATQATISSHKYRARLQELDPAVTVEEKACPLFVPLIENGYAGEGNPLTALAVSDYLDCYQNTGVDAVILGCTHYPLIRSAIRKELPDAEIFEAGKEAAMQLKQVLAEANLLKEDGIRGTREYFVSEMTESFRSTCELFLGESIEGSIQIHRFD